MEKSELFACPFCNTPYGEPISPGTSIAKCSNCGLLMLVPPSYGGTAEQCSSHPKEMAVGFCYNCGKSICKRCLHVAETVDQRSGRVVKSVLCPDCFQELEAEEAREKLGKRIVFASIALIIVIFGAFIAHSIYIHSESIGSAGRNWGPFDSLEGGIYTMATPEDPREMSRNNLTNYFSDHGTPEDFISVVICKKELAYIEFKGSIIQPYLKRVTIKITTYTCGHAHWSMFTQMAVPTPHTETMTVFLGKLSPGSYQIVIELHNGGAIYWYRFPDEEEWHIGIESGTDGGMDTTTEYIMIT